MDAYMEDVTTQKEDYFDGRIEQLDDYQNEIADITGDWADEQSESMETYGDQTKEQVEEFADQSKEQFEDFADEMEVYGDELAVWEKERGSAIGAAEMLLNTIYDNYSRSFKRSVGYRWVIIGAINLALFILILVFIRRKDVV